MPQTSTNEPPDHVTESRDVIITIDPPDESSIPLEEPQQLEQTEQANSSSSPLAEVSTEKEEKEEENPTGNASTSGPLEECRICLMSDEVGQLIKPCHCTGSVQYAHLKCLKLWVHERADLHCEICQSMYTEEILPELEPDLRIGLEERSRRAHRHILNAADRETGNIHHRTAAERREDQRQYDTRRFWMRAVCLTVPLTILVVMLLFLGMNANDSEWAAILLRLVAFALPTIIVMRIVWTCWGVARSGRGYDDDGIRRAVAV